MARACIVCGRPSVPGRSRCYKHGPTSPKGPSPYDAEHQRLAKIVLRNAKVCHICGGGPRPDDPFQADDIQPLSLGGQNVLSNKAPAHRSCNIRKGGANRKRNLK